MSEPLPIHYARCWERWADDPADGKRKPARFIVPFVCVCDEPKPTVKYEDAFAALTFLLALAVTGWFYGVWACVVFAIGCTAAYLVGYDHGKEAS